MTGALTAQKNAFDGTENDAQEIFIGHHVLAHSSTLESTFHVI